MKERFFRIFLSQLLYQYFGASITDHSRVDFFPNCSGLTQNERLRFIAKARLTGLLVTRFFSVSSQKICMKKKISIMRRMISRGHEELKFSFEPTEILSHYNRVLKYDTNSSVLIVADEEGKVELIFPDGSRICHKMKHCVRSVAMVGTKMVIVSSLEDYSELFRITEENTLSLVDRLTHEKDANCADWHSKFGFIVTAGRDRVLKVWMPNSQNKLGCVLELKKHRSPVTKVICHHTLSLIASSCGDGNIILWVLTTDGTKILSYSILHGDNMGHPFIIFHPTKNLLFSGGRNGHLLVTDFNIDSSNHISTKSAEFEIPTLRGYYIYSISIHPILPLILIGTGGRYDEMTQNSPRLLFFSANFNKLNCTLQIPEKISGSSYYNGSTRGIFDGDDILMSNYHGRSLRRIKAI